MRRKQKKRSQSRRNKLSVSLFPFLAVLICTLGILIMMLVMAVKAADDQARQVQNESDADQQAEIDALESIRDVRLAQIEGLSMVRPEALDRLSDSRANRSHIEEQIRKLKRDFRSLGDELLQLDAESKKIAAMKDPEAPVLPEVPLMVEIVQPDDSENQQAIAELQNLEKEIELAEKQLDAKRDSADTSGPARFVIVPHKGGGGTFRRPIFMECTADAITLQPSGIRLAKSEFVPPLEPGNMLDSALLTIREYWRRYDLAGEEGSPYPLIVIRPGGAETFTLARHAMKSWDDEFGYELVEADKMLEFGSKDEQLEAEIQEAIKEARVRQQQRLAQSRYRQSKLAQAGTGAGPIGSRRKRGSRNYRPGLITAGSGGGFVSNAGQTNGYSEVGQSIQQQGEENEESFVAAASGESDEMATSDFESNVELDSSSSTSQDQMLAQSHGQTGTYEATTNSGPESSAVSSNPNSSQSGDQQLQNPYADTALAKERGSDWALPTQTPGATGYVRPIRVVCSHDALEVYSGRSSKRIPITGKTSDSIDALVDQVWDQIDDWGVPGPNAYWKPQLRFSILDGGRQRFLELKGLLYKSGLSLTSQNSPSSKNGEFESSSRGQR